MKLCIVGGGAASAYFIREILSRCPTAQIVLFEKTASLLGHLKSSVAPDQTSIRKTIPQLEAVFSDPRVLLFTGVEIGKDLNLFSIQKYYNAVLLGAGAKEESLSIPGNKHTLSSERLMKLVNGHKEEKLPCLKGTVAIIGNGNVSLDAARMLLSPKKHVYSSYLSRTSVDKVLIIGRGSPLSASFTAPVLSETLSLPLEVSCSSKAQQLLEESVQDRRASLILRCLHKKSSANNAGKKSGVNVPKKIEFVFWESTQRVSKISNKFIVETKDSAGRLHKREVDHVLSAIGYNSLKSLSHLTKDVAVPVYSIGWALTNGKGNLSDAHSSAISAAETLMQHYLSSAQSYKSV